MADLTRRSFIKKTSAGAAALGAVTIAPHLAGAAPFSGDSISAEHASAALTGPLIAHVRNVATGEIAILSGTKETIIFDRQLVATLVKSSR